MMRIRIRTINAVAGNNETAKSVHQGRRLEST